MFSSSGSSKEPALRRRGYLVRSQGSIRRTRAHEPLGDSSRVRGNPPRSPACDSVDAAP